MYQFIGISFVRVIKEAERSLVHFFNFWYEKSAVKFMTKLLTKDQIENRVKVFLELKNRVSNDPNFIKSIFINDKT